MLPVDSATVIEIGDLVYLDTDDAKPSSAQADQGTEAANQELFHDKFAGVAMQASRSGDTQPIRVATAGVFEFDCLSTTFEVGRPDRRAGGHGELGRRPVCQTRQSGRYACAGRHCEHHAARRTAGHGVEDVRRPWSVVSCGGESKPFPTTDHGQLTKANDTTFQFQLIYNQESQS
jgi:hypothetical protein